MNIKEKIKTLGELRASQWKSKTIQQELRDNLLERLKLGIPSFDHLIGYDDTVIPDLERAILSGHHINLLGLRGQAKTRIARSMVQLLDEWIPYLAGSEIYDNPLNPISTFGKALILKEGDKAPIEWLHRSERYGEKLATPDVSVADLIGDIDPIKAANLKLSLSSEEVIHYGLIPRSNRGLFVINEIPDLQPRIQVALFNILQEGDIQIRGFKLRLPLDIQFIFTANPEDYTNRGSIVTPLKDRIGSQILTHYPKTRDLAMSITAQEVLMQDERLKKIYVPKLAAELIEQIGIEARNSEYIDQKSGVSARLSITAMQNLLSAAERRLYLIDQAKGSIRMNDFNGVLSAINGKIELVYEGEQEGAAIVSKKLLSQAIRTLFAEYVEDLNKLKKKDAVSKFLAIENWFIQHDGLELSDFDSEDLYKEKLKTVDDLKNMAIKTGICNNEADEFFMMEFLLHGLSEFSKLSRKDSFGKNMFGDLMRSIFGS